MKRKFKYILGQWLNKITGFTTFLESESEKRAYEILRKSGWKVRKQYQIAPYRLDFYLSSVRVNVEIDGIDHLKRRFTDRQRDKVLAKKGIKTLRIPAHTLHTADLEKFILKKLKEIISKPIEEL